MPPRPQINVNAAAGTPTRLEAISVSLLTTANDFLALGPEWNDLFAASHVSHLFLTWEWLESWWETFGADLQPWILVARESTTGRLLGVAPFVLRCPWRGSSSRELAFLGATVGAGDHHDVLARRGSELAVATQFADVLHAHRRDWDVLALDFMAAHSPLVALLRARQSHRAMVWDTLCPFISLPATWEEFLASVSKNARRKLVKPAQYLEQDFGGHVECRKLTAVEDLPAALSELFTLHQACWNDRGQTGAFATEPLRAFHRRAAERFLPHGWLNLQRLRVLGRTIAVQYGFHYRGRNFNYQGGFDGEWSSYSPGTTLFALATRGAIAEGVREIDLLRGEEVYKSHWTKTARRNLRLRLATTTRGSLLVQAYLVYHAARRRFRAWRELKPSSCPFVDQREV